MDVFLRTGYGFRKRTDFVKVSIVCLFLKMSNMDGLLDDTDRYLSESKSIILQIFLSMIGDVLFGGNLDDVISGKINDVLNADSEEDDV
ncbi:MAG: hypothetical protein IKP20_04905 [Candidatus Methanomethylophilaceae archaeon]|nr:hypothetical protein [Candidatus Methanomethylophilaceae archaeon]